PQAPRTAHRQTMHGRRADFRRSRMSSACYQECHNMATRLQTSFSLPYHRPRRLRRNETLRGLVRETEVDASDFIYPLFIAPGSGLRHEVPSMPGVYNLSVDQLAAEAEDILAHD